MQFRLTYRGRLPAESRSETRARDKHRIRREIHQQLSELWRSHPFLRNYLKPRVSSWGMKDVNSPTVPTIQDIFEPREYGPSPVDEMASRHKYKGFAFVPLVGGEFGINTACALDILFLRRDDPGGLIGGGGDIDNRIKVLLDALKMPRSGDGFNPKNAPEQSETPFFCLLQDDSLITELRVATDRLLTPAVDDEKHTDVHLVIHCKTVLLRGSVHPDGGASAAFAT
jgi:hypothetical protein